MAKNGVVNKRGACLFETREYVSSQSNRIFCCIFVKEYNTVTGSTIRPILYFVDKSDCLCFQVNGNAECSKAFDDSLVLSIHQFITLQALGIQSRDIVESQKGTVNVTEIEKEGAIKAVFQSNEAVAVGIFSAWL